MVYFDYSAINAVHHGVLRMMSDLSFCAICGRQITQKAGDETRENYPMMHTAIHQKVGNINEYGLRDVFSVITGRQMTVGGRRYCSLTQWRSFCLVLKLSAGCIFHGRAKCNW